MKSSIGNKSTNILFVDLWSQMMIGKFDDISRTERSCFFFSPGQVPSSALFVLNASREDHVSAPASSFQARNC